MRATEERIARFVVETKDGEIPPEALRTAGEAAFDCVLTRSTNRHTMHGTPKDPLSRDELVGKFESNAGLTLAPDVVKRAAELWLHVDQIPDIRQAMAVVAG